MPHLLSLLIVTPLAAALAGLLIPHTYRQVFKFLALAVSIVQCFLLYSIAHSYTPSAGFQLIEKASWITFDIGALGVFQAEYFVGMDGLSMTLVSLSVLILLTAVIASWSLDKGVKGYFVLLLVLNGSIIGTFCSLDLLL